MLAGMEASNTPHVLSPSSVVNDMQNYHLLNSPKSKKNFIVLKLMFYTLKKITFIFNLWDYEHLKRLIGMFKRNCNVASL